MIDLHIHTNFSDGSFSPEEIFQFAQNADLQAISITDHDSIAALDYIKDLMMKYKIECIPGVEISSNFNNKDIHILAYFPDKTNKLFLDMLNETQHYRTSRAKEILFNLKKMDINISFEYLNKFIGKTKNIGRLHIAKAIINKGYCSSFQKVFQDYIGDEAPAFVPKKSPTTQEVIAIAKKAGAITVVAHPFLFNDDKILLDIINMGIDGIESFTPLQDKISSSYYTSIAQKYNLLVTGGSDFHYQTNMRKLGDFSIEDKYLYYLKRMKYGSK